MTTDPKKHDQMRSKGERPGQAEKSKVAQTMTVAEMECAPLADSSFLSETGPVGVCNLLATRSLPLPQVSNMKKSERMEKGKKHGSDIPTMVQVGFRVTPKELKLIDRKAFDKGMSRADYLRQKYRDGDNNADLQASVEGLRDKLDLVHEAVEDLSRQLERSETKLSREILTLDAEIVVKVVDEIYARLERRDAKK